MSFPFLQFLLLERSVAESFWISGQGENAPPAARGHGHLGGVHQTEVLRARHAQAFVSREDYHRQKHYDFCSKQASAASKQRKAAEVRLCRGSVGLHHLPETVLLPGGLSELCPGG